MGLAVVAVLGTGCNGATTGGDKAGGRPEPLVLRMAITANSYARPAAIAYFVRRVRSLSGDTMQVEVIGHWGNWAPDAEIRVARAVASGRVDLGGVDTAALDAAGLMSLQALSAPMLVDSYPLVKAVLESPIPGQMLDDLRPVGVVGLGLVFQSFARPLSSRRPLLSREDWRGVGFGTARSAVREEAIRVLGARPVVAIGPFRDEALDTGEIRGLAFSIDAYTEEFRIGTAAQLPYVAANVLLWPRFDVLLADPHVFASLSDQQRAWVQQAADDATTFSEELGSREDRYARNACAMGVRFASAGPADLASMRRALHPIYRAMEQDPATEAFIHQIGELKRTTPPSVLQIPPDCIWSRAA